MTEARRVVVTGASGVLGTAVYNAFKAAEWNTIGLARSGIAPGLTQIDLLDEAAVEALFRHSRPHWVVHCAAERRPDVVEKVRFRLLEEQILTTLRMDQQLRRYLH
jgi:S-adenosylmethionine synthetase